jgi:serine/threonine-protein kinase RsbW/stage II sporulation protein AB (anti-sigma F factor)
MRHELRGFCERARIPRAVTSDVEVAATEAATNAIVHAFIGAEAGLITIAMCVEGAKIVVEVSDDGSGMAPRVDSPGLGLGVPLMRKLSESVDIEPGPRQKGTRVRMRFRA